MAARINTSVSLLLISENVSLGVIFEAQIVNWLHVQEFRASKLTFLNSFILIRDMLSPTIQNFCLYNVLSPKPKCC